MAEAKAALLLSDIPLGSNEIKVTLSDELTLATQTAIAAATVASKPPLPLPVPTAVPLMTPIRPIIPLPVPMLSLPMAPMPLMMGFREGSPPLLPNPMLTTGDPSRAEEISRTIYIGNISTGVTEDDLTKFFSSVGPVAYCKLAGGDPAQQTRFAFLEFVDFASVQIALRLSGVMFAERALK